MILPRILQRRRQREGSRGRIEDLERLASGADASAAAGDQHAAVGEQRRGVMAARVIHRRQLDECALRRIVEFRRGNRCCPSC